MVKCQSALPDPQRKQRQGKPTYCNANTSRGLALILSLYSGKSISIQLHFPLSYQMVLIREKYIFELIAYLLYLLTSLRKGSNCYNTPALIINKTNQGEKENRLGVVLGGLLRALSECLKGFHRCITFGMLDLLTLPLKKILFSAE